MNQVNELFRYVFRSELTGQHKGAYVINFDNTSAKEKYAILKKFVDNGNKGTLGVDSNGKLVYREKSAFIKGGGLSGSGFNAGYE